MDRRAFLATALTGLATTLGLTIPTSLRVRADEVAQ